MLALGSTVWKFDENAREYKKDGSGHQRLVYRSHFVERTIVGETTRSWVLDDRTSVLKKELTYKHWSGSRARLWTSAQEIADSCYIHDNAGPISNRVLYLKNAAKLKAIEELLGED